MKRLVFIAMLAATLLAACSSGSSSTKSSSGGASGSTKSGNSSTKAASAAASGGAAAVKVGTIKLGSIVTDQAGMTLYYFEADHGTTSACTPVPACKSNWPAVMAGASPAGGSGINASKLAVAPNGQLTYYGRLMYHFAGDHSAGDANGIGIPKWYPISPQGKEVSAPGT